MPRDSRRASEGLVGRGAFPGVEYAGKWRDLPESAGVLAGIEHAGCNVRDRQFQDSVLLADERGRVGFTSRSMGSLECVDAVRARTRWTRR